MSHDRIAPPENVNTLKKELHKHYGDKRFLDCQNMGQVLRIHLKTLFKDDE